MEDKAELRVIPEAFTEYAALTSQITDEIVDKTLRQSTEPGVMMDRIANELSVPFRRSRRCWGTDFLRQTEGSVTA